MGNGRPDLFESQPLRPTMTDRQLAEMRGVLNRGLVPSGPAVEPLSSICDLSTGQIVGCTDSINLVPLSSQPDAREIRLMLVLSDTYETFRDGTACLLRLASILELSASNDLFVASPASFFDVVGHIVTICETIIARTKGSYRLFADTRTYQPLDPRVLAISPLKDYQNWKSLYDQRKAVLAGKALVRASVPVKEHAIALQDEDGWQKAMDDVGKAAETAVVAAEVTDAPDNDMPLVSGYIANVKALTFADLEAQSRARYGYGVRDDSVYDRVELIIYHSVYSVLLDREGNPAFLPHFPYAFIIPRPGVPMERRMQPEGLYLGTGKLADYQFAVDAKDPKKVRSILFGGIGGLVETLNTFSWEHELHTQLQAYIDFNGVYAVPVIVTPQAFNSGALTIGKAYDRMPEIIEHTARHMYAELARRLANLYENYGDILKQVGVDLVKSIVVDQIKSWAVEYLVKKLGKKILPVVNAISAVVDALDDEELAMTRAALTALVMAVKSKSPDDMTISSKVLAKIGTDKVQARVVQELSKRGAHLVKKAHGAAKTKIAQKTQKPDAPPADEPALDAGEARSVPARPDDPATAKGTVDPKTQRPPSIADEMRRVNEMAEAYRKGQEKGRGAPDQSTKAKVRDDDDDAAGDPAARKRAGAATDAKETTATGTAGKATAATGTTSKGTPTRSAAPVEPPLPPTAKEASRRDRLEFLKQNKKQYSPEVERMIDLEVLRSMRKKPAVDKAGAKRINDAIKKENRKKKGNYAPIPDDMSAAERLEHVRKHRQDYPESVQRAIDKEIENAEAPSSKGGLARIDRAIRDDYARQLSEHWGIPVSSVSRIPKRKGEDTSGGDWEKTNIALRTGKRPNLSATSNTKAGEPVQIDDFDETRRVPREYKASLEIESKDKQLAEHEIEQRMAKHAEFAEDYGLPAYEWVAHSPASKAKMEKALTALRAQAASHPDPAVRQRMQKRLEKIRIVDEPFFDEPPKKDDE